MKMKFTLMIALAMGTLSSFAQISMPKNEISLYSSAGGGIWNNPARNSADYFSNSRMWSLAYRRQSDNLAYWGASMDYSGGRLAPENNNGAELAFMQFKFNAEYSFNLLQREHWALSSGLRYQALGRLVSDQAKFDEGMPYQHFSRQGIDLSLGSRYQNNSWTLKADASLPLLSWVDLSAPAENAELNSDLLNNVFGANQFMGWHKYFAFDLRFEAQYALNSWFALSALYQGDLQVMSKSNQLQFSDSHLGIGANFRF